ncbi:MAG: DUF4968 domain-containing protein, partial [Syntrophothermus sp.]
MKLLLILSLLFYVHASFAQPVIKYEKLPDGIIISLKKITDSDAALLKLQVCTENIIHIKISPGEMISERPSLMAENTEWNPVQWSLDDKNGYLELSTPKLNVKINKGNGVLTFFDNMGRVLLKERTESSRIITPAEVMG